MFLIKLKESMAGVLCKTTSISVQLTQNKDLFDVPFYTFENMINNKKMLTLQ